MIEVHNGGMNTIANDGKENNKKRAALDSALEISKTVTGYLRLKNSDGTFPAGSTNESKPHQNFPYYEITEPLFPSLPQTRLLPLYIPLV